MKSIGLTGGIGSGKSTVASLFERLGYQVYYADVRSKALQTEDEAVRSGIIALLGPQSYLSDGNPDRAYIASIVFKDKEKLAALNAISHPAVQRDYERWIAQLQAQHYDKPFVLKEAAILYEAGTASKQDGVIMVYAPKSIRIARVAARDQASKAAILDRMRNQWPDARKLQRADYHIFNDGQHPLIPQVMAAAAHYTQKWQ